MDYAERLREKAGESGIVCMGIDPVLEKIPLKGNAESVISKFFLDILDSIITENAPLNTVKPNIAYFEQYGFEGLRALKSIIEECQKKDLIVILDGKMGDIGKSSAAYAKAAFDFWGADAVTVNPYMGSDSVEPFLQYMKKGKGVYALCRTSNSGAKDFQDLQSEGKPLYIRVAEKIAEWECGAVVGATNIREFEALAKFFSKHNAPLLIPGVGAQGGSATEVAKTLKKAGMDLKTARINSSSGITYSFKKGEDYAGAAVKEIKRLNREIGKV